jgi:hypothetical protein
MKSLSVTASFGVNGKRAGTELAPLFARTDDHIWTMNVSPAITNLGSGQITASIKDKQGNIAKVVRSFRIQ